MGKVVLAGIFSLAASTALAQVVAAPEPEQAGGEGPANLCQELLAFMEAPPPEQATSTPAPAPTAPASPAQAGSAQAADAPAGEGAASETEAAAAGEESEPASGEAVPPQPVEETQSAQEASGQTGPAHEAPEPNSKSAEDGKTQKADQTSGLSAPVPTDPPSTPKDSILSLAEAEELARANDIAACQAAGRKLRLAGVGVPPPLLALTALDLKYHQTGEPRSQAPEAEPAAGQQRAPAPQTGD